MITPEQLAAWKAAEEMATKGPWTVKWTDDARAADDSEADRRCDGITAPLAPEDKHWDGPPEDVDIVIADSGVYPPRGHDATFIAIARTAVPALIAEVERLQAGIATLAREVSFAAESVRTSGSLTAAERAADDDRIVNELLAPLIAERNAAVASASRMQAVYEASMELRRVESTPVPGESIADLHANIPGAQQRSQRELTRWRTVLDAALAVEGKL